MQEWREKLWQQYWFRRYWMLWLWGFVSAGLVDFLALWKAVFGFQNALGNEFAVTLAGILVLLSRWRNVLPSNGASNTQKGSGNRDSEPDFWTDYVTYWTNSRPRNLFLLTVFLLLAIANVLMEWESRGHPPQIPTGATFLRGFATLLAGGFFGSLLVVVTERRKNAKADGHEV